MKTQRIKAFTLLEITISMLIAGLLIGLTYTIYTIITRSYHSFTEKNNDVAVILSLDHVLKRDFDRADSVLKDSDGVALYKNDHIIRYVFEPDIIVRKSTKTDTFKVQNLELKTTFENVPLNELQTSGELNRIDALGFNILFQSEKIPYHYHKLYSSENLIKRNPDAVN